MPGQKRPSGTGTTIRTVAAHAGVSAMTVSNVINVRGKVGEETRRRVQAAIAELGYLPNMAARGLASPGASRMGVLYERPGSPFVSAILVSALLATSGRGVQLLARDCQGATYDGLVQRLRDLKRTGATSFLLLPPFAEALSGTPIISELGVPFGAISTGSALPDMLTVRIDEHAATKSLTRLLLAHGHRRIGFIAGPPSHSGSCARREGFIAAMREANVAVPGELQVEGDYNFASGLVAASTLLALTERPTAIFAANDEMAAATAWTAHRLGISMPEQLAIAGFDDSPIAAQMFPSLTAVHQPVEEMARSITESLIDAMTDPAAAARERDTVVAFSLVERESTRVGTK